jgi:diguanylate cyclase (GGDEF)-like protein
MAQARRPGIGGGLRGLLHVGGEPYAGADLRNAGRLVALLWLLSGVLTLAFLPFDPPTAEIGAGGWPAAGALIVISGLGARWLVRRDPPVGFDALLAVSYLGLLQVLLLEWIAGGPDSAYRELTLLWIGSAMGVHPPRRALPFLATAGVVAFAPLAIDGWSAEAGADLAVDYIMWAALGIVVLVLMVSVRAQRVRLRAEEEQAQQLARVDELTGLGNRRAFDEALPAELARAERAGSPVSTALIDIDGFKQYNDRYGHLEGDHGLRQVAAAITGAMRAGDRGFRWGGDEFAVILPDTDFAGAELALTRIAAAVASSCRTPDEHPITCSWGGAEATGDRNSRELLDQADLALMVHKRARLAESRESG